MYCVNLNLRYTSNFYNVLNFDERNEVERMKTFVETEFSKARNNSEKVAPQSSIVLLLLLYMESVKR